MYEPDNLYPNLYLLLVEGNNKGLVVGIILSMETTTNEKLSVQVEVINKGKIFIL
jgi:hypothetical protein